VRLDQHRRGETTAAGIGAAPEVTAGLLGGPRTARIVDALGPIARFLLAPLRGPHRRRA
jgi:hypothetical protein